MSWWPAPLGRQRIHELRTPLTLEQAMLEVALAHPEPTIGTFRTTSEYVQAASRRQGRIIEVLPTLARSQRGLEHREVLDLGAVIERVLHSFAAQARSRGVTVRSTQA